MVKTFRYGRTCGQAVPSNSVIARFCRAVSVRAAGAALLAAAALTTAAPAQIDIEGPWSDFLPSSDTRIIYVSSSQGNDNNDGLSPQTPVRTLVRGHDLLRHSRPDWMLLRSGDVWFETMNWQKSGRSAEEPIRLSSYGNHRNRPRLVTSGGGFIAGNQRSNIAITGIHFQSQNGGGDGMRIVLSYGENWLIEDCFIEGYKDNINLQGFGSPGTIHNVTIRRSIIANAASTGSGHSQGIYADRVHGLIIEQCLIDHNGWSQNTNPGAPGYPTIFSHNVYIQTGCTDVIFRGNIVSRAGSHGVQMRPGGVVANNLFIRNPIAIMFGGGDPDPQTHTNGITGSVRRNVILDGTNINPTTPRGFGMDVMNVASAVIRENIIAHQTLGTQPRAISFEGTVYGSGVGVRNTEVFDNIVYKWGGSVRMMGGASNFHNVTFRNNDVQIYDNSHVVEHSVANSVNALTSFDNRMYTTRNNGSWFNVGGSNHSFKSWTSLVSDGSSVAEEASYADPERTIATYNASVGGAASFNDFIAEVRQQSRSNWRRAYTASIINNYFREGFNWE